MHSPSYFQLPKSLRERQHQQLKTLFGEFEEPKLLGEPTEEQINESLTQKQFMKDFRHLKQTLMIVNNYIDNHLTDF